MGYPLRSNIPPERWCKKIRCEQLPDWSGCCIGNWEDCVKDPKYQEWLLDSYNGILRLYTNGDHDYGGNLDPKNARLDTVDRAIEAGLLEKHQVSVFVDWLVKNGAREGLKKHHEYVPALYL